MTFSVNAQVNRIILDNSIRRVVESLPYFDSSKCVDLKDKQKIKCAEEAMFELVYDNLNYPEEARKNKVEGKVVIKFIVEKDGNLIDFEIVKNLEKGCGTAALKAAQTLKEFVPAQLKNQSVRVYYHLPVVFNLNRK